MTARDPLTAAAEEAMNDRGDREREAAWEASAGAAPLPARHDGYSSIQPSRSDEFDWEEERHRGWSS